jgi:hypothetical protein
VGHFAPLTNQFAVTNFPFPQKFTGNVVSNSTSTTLPNAVVLLFPPPKPGNKGPSGPPLAGMVANNAGSYTVMAPAGTYTLVAFRSNFVANLNTSPVLTLAASQTITTNLTLTNATSSITGKIMDANNASIGLSGMISAMSANGLLAISFTDTNGNFNMPVTAGTWKIQANDTTLIVHGYLGLQNGTNVNAGTTGITIAVPKATALIYGSVKDNLGNPLVGLDVYANDNNNLYRTDGYTDASGNYVLGVLGLGSSDSWGMQADSNNTLTNYVFSQATINGNINAGQAVLQNFTAVLATNYITGNVKTNGTNIVGVGVNANATIGGVGYQSHVDTDINGNYSLNVANGTWSISVNCSGGSDSLDNILGSGTYQCPGPQTATINDNNGTANFTGIPPQPLQMTTTSLPNGTVGAYYNQSLAASGGWSPYNWSLSPGSAPLPPSLTLQANGTLSGTPASLGTFYFFVRVTDAAMATDDQLLSLTVGIASFLQVTTGILPEGVRGTSYSQQLVASGGQIPYIWSLSPGSVSLPPGLTLSTNGILSGTPASGGNFYFFVRVADRMTATDDQLLFLDILDVATTSLPNGVQGTSYSQPLVASGGQSPYSWSLSPGSASLPPGLTLSTNGILSGVPSTNGVFTFSVSVTDGATLSVSRSLSFVTMPSFQTLLQMPTLSLPVLLPLGGCQFTVSGIGGQFYTLEYSTNLVNWMALLTTNFIGSSFTYTDFPATDRCRFYRAQAAGATFKFMHPLFYTSPTNGSAIIPVLRSGGLASGLYVNYATTTNGTATAGVDYGPVTGTLYFPPTVTSNNIVVPVFSNNNTNQDLTVVVRLSSLDGKIKQFAVLDIQGPQSTPAPVMVVSPGSLTFVLPDNCAQTVTVSNDGPPGSVLNYLAIDEGYLGYQLSSDGITGEYVIGTLPAGTSAQFQVSVLTNLAPFFEDIGALFHDTWPMMTTWINFYQLSANHQASEIPAAVIYPAEITTADRVAAKYIGTWSGTWSGTSSPMTSNPPTNYIGGGTWTLNIQEFKRGGQVSGSFRWQGTDAYWSEAPFTSFPLPVNLEATFTNWTYSVLCDGKTVQVFPQYPIGGSALYQLQINEFLFGGSGPGNWTSTVLSGWPSVSGGTYTW